MKIDLIIPKEVSRITKTLEEGGFSAYLVGGCVRDLLMNRPPKDWDITTNATPDQIVGLFPKTVYENTFGTVTVINEDIEPLDLRHIEVTPFRTEGAYSDKRHPDKVEFGTSLTEDLKRRDFTINALAYSPSNGQLVDEFGGVKDIKDKIIRAVGEAEVRLGEDPLRIMRAIRLEAQLGFTINLETKKALRGQAADLSSISTERIRDEFEKLIMSANPMSGLESMKDCGVLSYVIRETGEMVGVEQGGAHIYDVWEHSLRALQHAAAKNGSLEIRLAALFHDIGKPKTRRSSTVVGKKAYTFYGHEVVGARMVKKILTELKFPQKTINIVERLVRNHMFFADTDQITLSAVRRLVAKVGPDLVWDLMTIRACDRIGMGRPKEDPYRLRKYEAMIEEAMRAPTSVGMLKLDGNDLIKLSQEKPGPKIGFILHALLEEVLDKPELNNRNYLENKALDLLKLPLEKLKKLGEAGKEKKEETEEGELAEIRKRHRV
ncbi:MAG: HD domain-containing protein [Candidatus Vogelbacteria bacterium]|nr:HD domain-containing protein [Candidatus Vogelbacteria bacterium]